MIEKLFGRFLQKRKSRPFSAWQIELTTRCPLLCKMCIRSESTEWQFQDMPFEDFKKILPYLRDVETVVLEGWGESLLHPELSECVRLAKNEGSRVGFVTSGMGLTRDRVAELVEAGLDFAGFSVSGTTPETHDAIRLNSSLPEVLAAIRLFQDERERLGLPGPEIHIIFLMVRDNAHEVPSLPAFAKAAGVQEVVITNICHTINRWQESQRVFAWDNAVNPYDGIIEQARADAQKLNIRLKKPNLAAFHVPICAENPLRNLYISAKGEVSPCVYLYPPLPSPFRRIFCGKEYKTDQVSFGNIFQEPFEAIWNRREYVAFREQFVKRKKEYREATFALLQNPRLKNPGDNTLPEPPEPCNTCHKILGI